MLTLSRRLGETLKTGKDISLTIASIWGNQVKVSIDAPKSVAVVRSELPIPAEVLNQRTAKNRS